MQSNKFFNYFKRPLGHLKLAMSIFSKHNFEKFMSPGVPERRIVTN